MMGAGLFAAISLTGCGSLGDLLKAQAELGRELVKMTGRMADMSAQLGQSGQPTQSMEQMVREDQQEMSQQGMGMDPIMGGMDQGMGQPPMGGQPPMPGLQPQASLKREISNQLEKEALVQAALIGSMLADPISRGWGALKRMGNKFLYNQKIRGNPAGAAQYSMLKNRFGSKKVSTPEGLFRPSQSLWPSR